MIDARDSGNDPKAGPSLGPSPEPQAPVVVAVLAAGASTRMGRTKQLIEWKGTTLIRRAVQTAVDAGIGPVVVILGAEAEACLAAVSGMPIDEVIHTGWAEGMGTSVAVAAAFLHTQHPDAEALLVMACDQPGVRAADLVALRDARRERGLPMAAASYGGIIGIPALFARSVLPALMDLDGERGAGPILRARAGEVASVPCEAAALDLDTPADMAGLG